MKTAKTPRFELTGADIGGTCLKGELTISYAALKKAFGKPNGCSDGYKVSTEWVIRDAKTRQVITIYDYKVTNLYDPSEVSVKVFRALPKYDWHIGSSSAVDITALEEFIAAAQ